MGIKKNFSAPLASGLGGAVRRAATALLLMLLTTATAWADGYDYIDADGKLKNTATDDNTDNDQVNYIGGGDFTISDGWNIVNCNSLISIDNLPIDGDVHLIISGASELSIGHITIESGGSLTIYCQTVNEGLITVETGNLTAIDVEGSLTINGCTITANGSGSSSYGINVSGSVTVNGGSITANASGYDAHCINVSDGSSFTVNGGFVTANATGNYAHGINVVGTVTLNGGSVTAKATGDYGHGINVEGTVTLNGGTVTASSYNGNLTIANVCTYFDGTNTIDPGTSISSPADGATYQPEWTGSGTSDTDPILIKSTADLDLLAKRVNAGTDFSDTYFQLANDIWYNPNLLDDNEENYTAIGGQGKPFCGTFYGANHAIGGIRIYKDGTDDADSYQGLFGLVGTGGTVKNVILDNAWIAGYQHVGGIVGENAGGRVENCHVINYSYIDVVAEGADCHGDIAGSNSGTVTRCSSVAQHQNNSGSDNHQNHGGVVGSNSGTVSDCITNGGGIDGSSNIGAIVGYNTGTVSNSYSLYGRFSLVGNNDGGTVTSCGLAPQDTQDNSAFLTLMAQRTAALTAAEHGTPLDTDVDILLYDRTLYKDGKWNTLCLPFSYSAEQIHWDSFYNTATLMELDTEGKNGFDPEDGTLYLTFKEATEIRAGVPYLVKWDWDYDLTPPVFRDVTIAATFDPAATPTVTGSSEGLEPVQMVGCYSPAPVEANDKSILFLGEANTLYYSTVDRDIRSFRAYFSVPYIKEHAGAKARAFRLDFGDGEQTGIMTVQGEGFTVNGADAWYTLDGRKLDGKPATKGLYLNGGKKVVIK